MKQFDTQIARKYNYIKDCPEHQVITWIESNGLDARPVFYNQIHNSLSFLLRCLQEGEYRASHLSADIWQALQQIYRITNKSGNSLTSGLTVDHIIQQYGLPIMLSCDSYYLSYSKNFQSMHVGTRVIILDVDHETNRYLIGEAPFEICKWVEKELIQEAHISEQPGKGYYHIPRIHAEMTNKIDIPLLINALELRLAQIIHGAALDEQLITEIMRSPFIQKSSSLTFVLECFMHLQAGWMKLAGFLEWLEESIPLQGSLREKIQHCATAWQRIQLEYVKQLRKPDQFAAKFGEKLQSLRKQEYETYASLRDWIQELDIVHAY